MKKLISLLAALLVLGGLTACSAASEEKADTILIGVNLELTGDVSVYGVPERNAFEQAVSEVNAKGGIDGKLVELVIYDNAYDQAKAVQNTEKLIEDGVVAILGSATSGMTMAIAPLAKDNGLVVFTPSGTNSAVTMDGDVVNPYVFRSCFIDPFQGQVLANFASNDLAASKVVIMVNNGSEYSKELARIFTEQLNKNGGEVVETASYADSDTDYKASLTSIATKEFDVLFIADYAKNAGLIIGQARSTAGLEEVKIIGPDGFEDPQLNDLAGGAQNVNNVYFSTHFSPLSDNQKVADFVASYQAFTKAAGKEEPASVFAALAYDAAYMLFAAIDAADSTDPEAIRDSLESLPAFSGVTGDISFDALHNAVKPAFLIELNNGVAVNATIVNP
jgi:branched-chain amino acid transport system substrate-binding protein